MRSAVCSSYDQVPLSFNVTRMRKLTVWKAGSRKGFDRMPYISEPERGADLELGGVRLGGARGQEHLAAGVGERVDNGAGRGFPEPVPDLVVEGLDLTRLDDVGVIAQAVEQLRPVGLRVDRLQLVALDERVVLVAVDDRPVTSEPGPTGWTSAPSALVQMPARARSGPRLASVSSSPSASV